jgi:hypothetical protein
LSIQVSGACCELYEPYGIDLKQRYDFLIKVRLPQAVYVGKHSLLNGSRTGNQSYEEQSSSVIYS